MKHGEGNTVTRGPAGCKMVLCEHWQDQASWEFTLGHGNERRLQTDVCQPVFKISSAFGDGLPPGRRPGRSPSGKGTQGATYTQHVEDHCSLSPVFIGEDVPGEFMQG